MTQRPDFEVERLLECLTAHNVDFVIVGGVAAALLGTARDTFDLDICPSHEHANLDALGRALNELGARLRGVEEAVPFVPDRRALSQMEILMLETDAGELDVLMRPNGCPPYDQLRRNAERKDLGRFSVLVASIEDLIAMKSLPGRPKDHAVVEELRAIRKLRRQLGITD